MSEYTSVKSTKLVLKGLNKGWAFLWITITTRRYLHYHAQLTVVFTPTAANAKYANTLVQRNRSIMLRWGITVFISLSQLI